MNKRLKQLFQNVSLNDRIRGSLIGGAAGDALGYAVEFMQLSESCRTYGENEIQEYDMDPLAGEALIFDDDTQMTLLTADGLLRGAPVGLFRKDYGGAEVMMEGARAAAITHGHPMGCIPAGVLAFIIHRIVYGGEIDLYQIATEAQEMIPKVFGDSEMSRRMANYLGLAAMISRNESEEDWPNIGRLGQGWVGDEALAIAVYCCLRYYHDFNQCLSAAVNHDGDSDSTGAIAGNILGALYGYEALDAKWKENLELRDAILEVADDMYACIEGTMIETQRMRYKEGTKYETQ